MSVNINTELYVFFVSVICGVVCSAVFGFFRTAIRRYGQSASFVNLTDILFWLISCAVCYSALYFANDGRMRIYEFIAIAVGGFLYFLLLERVFNILFVNFFRIIEFILKILLTPARFLYKILIYTPAQWVCKLIKKLFKIAFGGNNEYNKNRKKNKHLRFNRKNKSILQKKQHTS